MYFNKKEVEYQLENGVDNGADMGEALAGLLEKVFAAKTMEEIKALKKEWDGE